MPGAGAPWLICQDDVPADVPAVTFLSLHLPPQPEAQTSPKQNTHLAKAGSEPSCSFIVYGFMGLWVYDGTGGWVQEKSFPGCR